METSSAHNLRRERIERVVDKYEIKAEGLSGTICKEAAVVLIRRELAKRDARARRIVKKEMNNGAYASTDYKRIQRDVCLALLSALRGRGKQ